MLTYDKLSTKVQEKITEDRKNNVINKYRCNDEDVIRRDNERDKATLWRPAFVRDVEKILHCPFYNRYADKTQVFSFYKNDDITRRSLHVQLVARIARNIGGLLGLNVDLIEAIALGHDLGHTPFGHAGEGFLSDLLEENTGRLFNHNVQSVRVLDTLFARNISLQTLDGILCHNGEFELKKYYPDKLTGFFDFDKKKEKCYVDRTIIKTLIPSTLEGCVVRVSDMIAYLGKDRQDARKAKLLESKRKFTGGVLGVENSSIINNMVVNIVENSYGKDYLIMDEKFYKELKNARGENYKYIYQDDQINKDYKENIKPMFNDVYYELLKQAKNINKTSVLYRHHIEYISGYRRYYPCKKKYYEEEPNQIVVDYIASMTDDYFVDLYHYLFPKGKYEVRYKSYFKEENI